MRSRKVRGIARDTLKFILEASRSSLPAEFAGLLQVDDEIITEVLILPGTENSRMSALIRLYMLPNMQVAGSAHSHPSGALLPSEPDIQFFSHRRLSHHSRSAFRRTFLGLLQCFRREARPCYP